jgi:hypothetical protein
MSINMSSARTKLRLLEAQAAALPAAAADESRWLGVLSIEMMRRLLRHVRRRRGGDPDAGATAGVDDLSPEELRGVTATEAVVSSLSPAAREQLLDAVGKARAGAPYSSHWEPHPTRGYVRVHPRGCRCRECVGWLAGQPLDPLRPHISDGAVAEIEGAVGGNSRGSS